MTPPCALAVDPGSAKCGLAVVCADLTCLHREIVVTEDLAARAVALVARYQPIAAVCGDGAASKAALPGLRDALGDLPIQLQAERNSTLEARERYLHANPPRGLARLVPPWFRVPPVPYDDWAAQIIGERYWLARPS